MNLDWVRHRLRSVAVAIGTGIGSVVLMSSPVSAQTLAGTVVELPAVIIEGATLGKPKAEPRKGKPVVLDPSSGAQASTAKKAPKKKPKAADEGVAASASVTSAPGGLDVAGDAGAGASVNAGIEGGVRADSLGTSVSVVSGDEIQAQQARTAVDVLRSMPGVSVSQQGGAGSVAVVRLRGAESNHTLVLIDGVEVNSGIDGFFDFSNLATSDIARIEVLRGPQSGLYGSGALGGVINIITHSGKGPARVVVEGEGGSFNSRGGRAGVSGGTDTAWGSFMVSSRHTDGFNIAPVGAERDGSDLKTLSLKGGVRPFENLTLQGSFRASRLETEYDDFSFDLPGYQQAVDAPYHSQNDTWSGRLAVDLVLFDDAWTQQIYATRSKRDFFDHSLDFNTFQLVDSKLIDEVTTYGYKSTVRLGAKEGGSVRHYVTGLIEHRSETFDQPTSNNFHAERDRLSLVGEVRGSYFGMLDLGASLRRDDNNAFQDTTDWRVDGSLKVASTPFRLHASYGTGTKLPSFAELYGKFSRYQPNPDLKPEQSKAWDIGVETRLLGGRGLVDVTYFSAYLTDEIVDVFRNGNFTTDNLDGDSTRRGIEVSGRLAVIDGVTVGASYTWLDARDDLGLRETRRPENQARFDVDWRSLNGRARLNLATIYNGPMVDVAFGQFYATSDRVSLDDYWLVRLAGSYEIAPGLEAFGRVENLLDQDYQEVFGYETAGIAAYAGLRLKLEAPQARPGR